MFNVKLYKDMLKQLRLSGIIFTALSVIVSCFVPIIILLGKSSQSDKDLYDFGHSVSLLSISPSLMAATFIAGLVWVLIAFSFLNKRSSSDYYHSLPNTRVCTYLSIMAAVCTWILIMVVSTVLLSSLVFFACGLSFNISYIFILIAAYSVSTLLVAAVVSVAMCITGTLFSNIVVTGLIGFLPRFIMLMIQLVISQKASIVDGVSFGMLDFSYNLPVAFAFNFFNNINYTDYTIYDNLLGSASSILYTFVLALLYLGLACFLFHKRKSETADKNAPSKILQHIYRCSISLPVFVFATAMLVVAGVDFSNFVVSLIIMLVAIIIYFVYELITTKKFKNLLTAAPYLLVVVVISAGIAFGSNIAITSILNKIPTAQEIKYVKLAPRNLHGDNIGYNSVGVQSIKHDNIVIKNIVSENLKDNVDEIKKDKYLYDNHDYLYATIVLNNGKKLERIIKFFKSDMETINTVMRENPAFYPRYRQIPSEDMISELRVERTNTAPESREIWEVYKQEIAELSDEDYYTLNSGNSRLGEAVGPQVIGVVSVVGTKRYVDNYPMSELTPKSANMHFNNVNKKVIEEHKKSMINLLTYDLDTASAEDYINFTIASGDEKVEEHYLNITGNAYSETSSSSITLEQAQSIATILQAGSITKFDLSQPLIYIQFGSPPFQVRTLLEEKKLEIPKTNQIYISVTKQQLKEIGDILKAGTK